MLVLLTALQFCIGSVASEEVVYNGTYRGLTAIPSDIPLSVTKLELDYNEFTTIPAGAFTQYTLLKSLHLSHCKLTSIADDAFDGCPIKYLRLHVNELPSMRQLYCLESISMTLSLIQLSYNPIYPASDPDWKNVLSKLGAVKELWLTRMAVTGMQTCPDLSDIASTLTVLSLGANSITVSLMAACFQGMGSLAELSLSNNGFENFPDLSSLPVNNNLKKLNLQKNVISSINMAHLENLTSLETLDLCDNHLTSFPDVRDSSLISLDLSANPLVCDSSLTWMKQLQSSSLEVVLDDAPCTAPEHLVGVLWDEITVMDLDPTTVPQSGGQINILLDGDDSTCISTTTELSVFRAEVSLEVPEPLAPVMSVSVVGELMGCDEDNNGLQFYVNTTPMTTPYLNTSCHEMTMKRCRFVEADTKLCHFECDCPVQSGGCQGGMLRKRQQMAETPGQICEIVVT